MDKGWLTPSLIVLSLNTLKPNMARRPKGSVLRTVVIQSKITPKVSDALTDLSKASGSTVSTTVQEMIEKSLFEQGLITEDD